MFINTMNTKDNVPGVYVCTAQIISVKQIFNMTMNESFHQPFPHAKLQSYQCIHFPVPSRVAQD